MVSLVCGGACGVWRVYHVCKLLRRHPDHRGPKTAARTRYLCVFEDLCFYIDAYFVCLWCVWCVACALHVQNCSAAMNVHTDTFVFIFFNIFLLFISNSSVTFPLGGHAYSAYNCIGQIISEFWVMTTGMRVMHILDKIIQQLYTPFVSLA